MKRNAAKTSFTLFGIPRVGQSDRKRASIAQKPLHVTRATFCALFAALFSAALALALSPAISPNWHTQLSAYADELTVIEGEISEWQAVIEQSSAALDDATKRMEEAEGKIKANQARLDELAVLIPQQEKRSNDAARELYKFEQQRFGILELLLGSDDFFALLQNWEYVNYITDANIQEIGRLHAMKAELDELQANLERDRATAEAEARNAENALKAAQEARAEAQRRAEEEARRQAAEEAARQAAEAAAAEAAQREAEGSGKAGSSSEGGSGGGSGEPISEPTSDGADWSSDKATFVDSWGARLDAYLSGSPLSGYGRTFAEAAWNYGIDPRFSAAISCVESSKGAQCFRPHNAWGWGSASWGSWEEAINAHASGLARIYGYTVTVEGAKKYCPPNWEFWYNRVCQEMAKI